MANLKLSDVQSGYNRGKINDNFKKLEQAINEETLQRDGSKDLKGDMNVNGKRLYNLGPAVDENDALSVANADVRFASKEYVDVGDAATLANAKQYADTTTLPAANAYTNSKTASTLSAAKAYTDQEVATERSQRISTDAAIRNEYQAADANIITNYQAADAHLQGQISDGDPLQASAFSEISWHDQVITNSVTIPDNKNAWSFGPTMAIAESATVTVGEGSFWTISNG